jgi:hypothetical protein
MTASMSLARSRSRSQPASMAPLVTGELICRLTGEKTYRREVGNCTTTDGTDGRRTRSIARSLSSCQEAQ